MMWGNGNNMAWGWPVGLLILAAVVVLVVWAIRAFAGGPDRGGRGGDGPVDSGRGERSQARQILDDRFAKGELNEVEYRERLKVLNDKAR
ncbi:SHOCT domain-containing protein [Cryobacterium sp. PH31-AA6]|uniref:SHOCT domain-containing protein n=1 Tax=Cryobacterium sp. PH31-AA6 TaxID=3046205 RepID=UPI0024BA6C7C|nr:SHOCT domain-containing protein [Cryobacterium sp. PH31-AA6]MDJ0325320.1 SHOCT domain-containing protein [Cryobacterium sp. PH31-AA6]